MQGKHRTGADTERREAELLAEFDKNYTSYQYRVVEFFAEHLADISKSFGGDFQQVMLLAILGQRRMGALRSVRGGQPPRLQDMSISASRLADTTGVPRETVRRKLVQMRETGWIAQTATGAWYILPGESEERGPVLRDLSALDQRGRRRVAKLVAALETFGTSTRG